MHLDWGFCLGDIGIGEFCPRGDIDRDYVLMPIRSLERLEALLAASTLCLHAWMFLWKLRVEALVSWVGL